MRNQIENCDFLIDQCHCIGKNTCAVINNQRKSYIEPIDQIILRELNGKYYLKENIGNMGNYSKIQEIQGPLV